MFSVDVAITAAVLYPVGRLGRNIQFTTSVKFREKETYYVTMSPGNYEGENIEALIYRLIYSYTCRVLRYVTTKPVSSAQAQRGIRGNQ